MEATEHVDSKGVIGLLLPAMTLFKDESTAFRQKFFQMCKVESVVNFANLVEVLFAGRSRVPCAAFFYRLRTKEVSSIPSDERIVTYAPFVINQESNRPPRFNRKLDTWSVTVNGSELREILALEAVGGDALVWKLAMWGSYRDRRLLDTVKQRFSDFEEVAARRHLEKLQGFELRDANSTEETIFVEELVGQHELSMNELRQFDRLFTFPPSALIEIPRKWAYLRKRGGTKPIIICRPPHVIVSASRKYAVFSNEFYCCTATAGWHSGAIARGRFAKLLSIYLSSDFAIYHQLLCAPRWGIHISDSNLSTLNALPTPFRTIEQR